MAAVTVPPPELLAEAHRNGDGIIALLRERERRDLAAALLAAAEPGAGTLASGPGDDIEVAEAEATRTVDYISLLRAADSTV